MKNYYNILNQTLPFKGVITVVFVLFFYFFSYGQNDSISDINKTKDTIEQRNLYDFRGYLKYMQTIGFTDATDISTDHLFHNRLNFRIYPHKTISLGIELRNRMFYGEGVKANPDYAEQVTDYDGILPLEYAWIDQPALVVNTIVDRLWFNWAYKKVELRVGRQRINWGINLAWNPNDLFNAFNFLDFDYEERPGADAIRLQIYPNYFSSFDIAYKFTGDWKRDVFALKYMFNKKGYDIQFLGGKFESDATIGIGWAGNIKNAGFKGEVQYFHDYNQWDSVGDFSAAATIDYTFGKGVYLLGSYLYNSTGFNYPAGFVFIGNILPSAKSLSPSKHTALVQTSYQLNPIMSINASVLYYFELNWLTIFPTYTYSIKPNLDFDVIAQLFWAEQNARFTNAGNAIFLRLKWSFGKK